MGFERWGYQFDGAYASPDSLQSRSGVMLIWCKKDVDWTVLDVGESADVRERVSNHERPLLASKLFRDNLLHCNLYTCFATIRKKRNRTKNKDFNKSTMWRTLICPDFVIYRRDTSHRLERLT